MGVYQSAIKVVLLVVVAIGGLGIYAGVAKADEVTFLGYTNGCFNCEAPPDYQCSC